MAPPAYTEKFHGKLAALKVLTSSQAAHEELDAQLETLWHYECVVSPRSPAPKPPSNPNSPCSPATPDHLQAIRPESVSPWSGSSSRVSPSTSPRSHASASPSPLSRFAPLQRVFSAFDENGDGSVSTHEISRIFEKLGLERSDSEDSLKSLLAEVPSLVTKAQGHVDEVEFQLLYESACSFAEVKASSSNLKDDVEQDLLAAFHVFDKDGNGFISPAELQSVLCSLGFPQGRQLEDCVDMIARVDENGDGHVDFFEFKKLFHMENPFMPTIQSC